jgi:hypothetical protein
MNFLIRLLLVCILPMASWAQGRGSDRLAPAVRAQDEAIEQQAAKRLVEVLGDRASITVTSFNRQVLLTGSVPDAASRALANQGQ